MFTGIVEDIGIILNIEEDGSNLVFTIESELSKELKIDQSLSHNGVCLTVTSCNSNTYTVVAIDETLAKSNLGQFKKGDSVNLERAMQLGDRLDGHIVQGHVDTTAICQSVIEEKGSWVFTFSYKASKEFMTVEKGSITVNGVSLTVFNSEENTFSVAIIPYTYENTNFRELQKGDTVNLEFDILGKYIQKLYEARH